MNLACRERQACHKQVHSLSRMALLRVAVLTSCAKPYCVRKNMSRSWLKLSVTIIPQSGWRLKMSSSMAMIYSRMLLFELGTYRSFESDNMTISYENNMHLRHYLVTRSRGRDSKDCLWTQLIGNNRPRHWLFRTRGTLRCDVTPVLALNVLHKQM